MGPLEYAETRQPKSPRTGHSPRTHPIVLLKRARKLITPELFQQKGVDSALD
jgi:hypothetical protein